MLRVRVIYLILAIIGTTFEGLCIGQAFSRDGITQDVRQNSVQIASIAVFAVFLLNIALVLILSNARNRLWNLILVFLGGLISFWTLGGWYALEKAVRRGW